MTTNFRIYAYLRASTKEQDATLKRPELFRLLDIAQTDDIILGLGLRIV